MSIYISLSCILLSISTVIVYTMGPVFMYVCTCIIYNVRDVLDGKYHVKNMKINNTYTNMYRTQQQ